MNCVKRVILRIAIYVLVQVFSPSTDRPAGRGHHSSRQRHTSFLGKKSMNTLRSLYKKFKERIFGHEGKPHNCSRWGVDCRKFKCPTKRDSYIFWIRLGFVYSVPSHECLYWDYCGRTCPNSKWVWNKYRMINTIKYILALGPLYMHLPQLMRDKFLDTYYFYVLDGETVRDSEAECSTHSSDAENMHDEGMIIFDNRKGENDYAVVIESKEFQGNIHAFCRHGTFASGLFIRRGLNAYCLCHAHSRNGAGFMLQFKREGLIIQRLPSPRRGVAYYEIKTHTSVPSLVSLGYSAVFQSNLMRMLRPGEVPTSLLKNIPPFYKDCLILGCPKEATTSCLGVCFLRKRRHCRLALVSDDTL